MEIGPEEKFRINLDSFIEFLTSISNNDNVTGLFVLSRTQIKNKNNNVVIENFIKHALPHIKIIKSKNEDFIRENLLDLFPNIQKNFLVTIRNFILEEVSNEDKEYIWEYIYTFVRLSGKYLLKNMSKSTYTEKEIREIFLKI